MEQDFQNFRIRKIIIQVVTLVNLFAVYRGKEVK